MNLPEPADYFFPLVKFHWNIISLYSRNRKINIYSSSSNINKSENKIKYKYIIKQRDYFLGENLREI